MPIRPVKEKEEKELQQAPDQDSDFLGELEGEKKRLSGSVTFLGKPKKEKPEQEVAPYQGPEPTERGTLGELGAGLARGIITTTGDIFAGLPRQFIAGGHAGAEAVARRSVSDLGKIAELHKDETGVSSADIQRGSEQLERQLTEPIIKQAQEADRPLGYFQDAFTQMAEENFPASESLKDKHGNIKNPVDNPEVLLDSNWWASQLGEQAPSMVATVLPAGLLSKTGKLSRTGSIVFGSGLGAQLEASNVYNEAIRRGDTPSEALRKWGGALGASGALNAMGLEFLLRKIPKPVRGQLLKNTAKITGTLGARGTVEGLTESTEELVQAGILGEDAATAIKSALTVLPTSLVLGTLAAGGGATLSGEFSAQDRADGLSPANERAEAGPVNEEQFTDEPVDNSQFTDDTIPEEATPVQPGDDTTLRPPPEGDVDFSDLPDDFIEQSKKITKEKQKQAQAEQGEQGPKVRPATPEEEQEAQAPETPQEIQEQQEATKPEPQEAPQEEKPASPVPEQPKEEETPQETPQEPEKQTEQEGPKVRPASPEEEAETGEQSVEEEERQRDQAANYIATAILQEPKRAQSFVDSLKKQDQADAVERVKSHLKRRGASDEIMAAFGEPAQETAQEAVQETAQGSVQEPVEEAPQETAQEAAPIQEAAPTQESDTDKRLRESDDPVHQLAGRAKKELDAGNKLDNTTINRMAKEVYGTSIGHARDALDAAEMAMNLHLEESGAIDMSDPKGTLERIEAVLERMPTQNRRDDVQVKQQAFSTVPTEAVPLVYAAGISPGSKVIEPSAGTGVLASMARASGAEVATNEIDKRRVGILKAQKFNPTEHDASQLDNILPEGEQYDVVVMNPPFSASLKSDKNDTSKGARHIEQALRRLKPGGRLVAIVGRGMAPQRSKMRPWWEKIAKNYSVRANISMSGKHYRKFGTTFDNQIIVIDNTGPTANESQAITTGSDMVSPSEAIDLLAPLAKENVNARTKQAEKPVRDVGEQSPDSTKSDTGTSEVTETRPDSRDDRPYTGGGRDAGGRELRGGSTERDGDRSVEQPGVIESETAVEDSAEGDRQGRSDLADTEAEVSGIDGREGLESDGESSGVAGVSDTTGDRTTPVEESQDDTKAGFEPYKPKKLSIKGAKSHPGAIVESASLAATSAPEIKYKPNIPKDVIKSGKLSDIQLEFISYAGQAHEQKLPDGSRRGIWNGDGTGVGKGRQLQGVIWDNYRRGRKKALYLSFNQQLYSDAKRDAKDLGHGIPIHRINDWKNSDQLDVSEGILYSTYSTASDSWKGSRKRFKQIVDWLGKDFDGVIIFDEAHKMKGAVGSGFGDKTTQGTDTGEMGLELQSVLPNARIVYASATGATEARNMAPYTRLGLWGEGTPFKDFISFLDAMRRGGVGMLEILSRNLKSRGTFLSRTISYDGVKYDDKLKYELNKNEEEEFNRLADFWNTMRQKMEEAAGNAGWSKQKFSRQNALFYSSQQAFFLDMFTGYQMPQIISEAEKDIKEGRAPVISLVRTGQSDINRAREQQGLTGDEGGDVDLTPRQRLVDLIERHFPVTEQEQVTDPVTGKTTTVDAVDAAGNLIENRENLAERQRLIDIVADLSMPESPLDMVMNHFGPDRVAEISGRSHRVIKGKIEKRKIKGVPNKHLNTHETKEFQAGNRDIAVITGAGTTGISLHTDRGAKNKKPRTFYTAQLFWSADTQMQAFGRVHRSNQENAPTIRLARVNVSGQERLVNTIASRLASLGAISKGERKSLGGSLFEQQDLTDDFGVRALASTYSAIEQGKFEEDGIGRETLMRMGVLDSNGNIKNQSRQNVDQFLNRIMALPVTQQNKIFEAFYGNYISHLERAKASGELDFGVEEIRANNLEIESSEVVHEDDSGSQVEIYTLKGEQPVSTTDYLRAFNTAVGSNGMGFWRNNASGRLFTVERHASPEKTHTHAMVRDEKGSSKSVELSALRERYTREPDAASPGKNSKAEKQWTEQVVNAPKTKSVKFHLVTGPIITQYEKIIGVMGRVRSKRAKVGDQSIVGVEANGREVATIRQRFGVGAPLAQASGQEIANLLSDNATIELDNGWRLQQVNFQGERTVEVVVPTGGRYLNPADLKRHGFSKEIVSHRARWLADPNRVVSTLDSLLREHKAIRDTTSPNSETSTDSDASSPAFAGRRQETPMPETPQTKQAKKKRERQTKQDIRQFISEKFNVPLRSKGTHKMGKRLGFYTVPNEVIVALDWGDIETLAHELGHHVHKIIWGARGNSILEKKQFRKFKAELADMDYDQRKRRTHEGFAEYIRYLMLGDIETIEKMAPKFHNWFQKEVLSENPEIKKNLDILQSKFENWANQGAMDRVISQIGGTQKPGGLREAAHSLWVRWRDLFVNNMAAFEDILKHSKLDPDKISPLANPNKMMLALKEKADVYAASFVLKNARNLKGEIVGRPLAQIIEPVVNDMERFSAYIYARRALDLHKRGINPGISKNDAQYVFNELDNTEWREVSDEITEWHGHLLDVLVDSGTLSKDQAKRVRELNPVYFPLYRSFVGEGFAKLGRKGGSSKGVADQPKGLKGIRGSGRPIDDPLVNMATYAMHVFSIANKNRVAQAVLKSIDEGLEGEFGRRVPRPTGVASVSAEQAFNTLQEMGIIEPGTFDVERDGDAILTLFTQENKHTGKENIVSVWRDGKQEWIEVQEELYKAMKEMDSVHLPEFFRIITMTTKLVRLGATGINPDFAAANFTRDSLTVATNEQYGKAGPFSAISGLMQLVRNKFNSNDDLINLFEERGALKSGFVGSDVQAMKNMRKKILASSEKNKKKKAVNAILSPIDSLQRVIGVTEVAPRIVEFKSAYNHFIDQGLTEEEAFIEAMNAGQDITLNFSRSGTWGRMINQFVPFFNAAIQDPSKIARMLANPKTRYKFLARGIGYLTIPTLALWWANKDEPWYQELASWERAAFWHIKIGDSVLRVPKPFLIGAIFASTPESIMDSLYANDPQLIKDTIGDAIQKQVPIDSPGRAFGVAAVAPATDLRSNKTWYGGPLIPRDLQDEAPENQTQYWTPGVYNQLGKALGVSPIKLDYLAGAYTGGITRRMTQIFDAVKRASKGEKVYMSDAPVIGRFLRRVSFSPMRSQEQFYKRLDKLREGKKRDSLSEEQHWELMALEQANTDLGDINDAIRAARKERDSMTEDQLLRVKAQVLWAVLGKKPPKDWIEDSQFPNR